MKSCDGTFEEVFPIYVGVILKKNGDEESPLRIPHIRGGDFYAVFRALFFFCIPHVSVGFRTCHFLSGIMSYSQCVCYARKHSNGASFLSAEENNHE